MFYDYLINSLGKESAKQYLNANEKAIQNIKKIIQEEKIDCDFEQQDNYVFTQSEDEVKKIKKEVEVVNSLGFNAEYIDSINIPIKEINKNNIEKNKNQEINISKPVLAAIKFPNQAQFNSYKYILGLANIIEENKGKIYENSKVIDLKKDVGGYIVETEEASVRAKYVIIASHYPIINFPGFYFMKMYQETSYLIAVETSKELFDGMYINSENPTVSFRTALYNGKRVLIVGGKSHKTGAKIDLEKSYSNLENVAKTLYPDCKTLFRWNTEDCIPLDKIPYIGEFSNFMPNVYVGTGYKKWGMTSSNIAANIITDKILGRENEYEEVFNSKRLKPIKNYEELTNMVKEVGYSLIINKLKKTDENLEDVESDEGKMIEIDNKKVGIYKDKQGNVYAVKPYCTHLGCELSWNNLDKTWDCPCHGSRFDYKGKNLYDPALKDLENRQL